ncbi:hypothetical protein AVEN_169944-1 [Araneus ventricosus]|uniref:Uncharacterized protein n=1 Tax=Araneus ventricosus TaxID=182803 RepID=A0A4Y2GH51_ARAVE|nr:hypothetical protein AVEN_169944-1 [Araneus ventricosus]
MMKIRKLLPCKNRRKGNDEKHLLFFRANMIHLDGFAEETADEENGDIVPSEFYQIYIRSLDQVHDIIKYQSYHSDSHIGMTDSVSSSVVMLCLFYYYA